MTVTAPAPINATTLKRWFKQHYGLFVYVRSGGFIEVYLRGERQGNQYVYPRTFAPALGNACLRIVYPNSPSLHEQSWGGNVRSVSIAMKADEWAALLAGPVPSRGDGGAQVN